MSSTRQAGSLFLTADDWCALHGHLACSRLLLLTSCSCRTHGSTSCTSTNHTRLRLSHNYSLDGTRCHLLLPCVRGSQPCEFLLQLLLQWGHLMQCHDTNKALHLHRRFMLLYSHLEQHKNQAQDELSC
jgi:hypothetical protein